MPRRIWTPTSVGVTQRLWLRLAHFQRHPGGVMAKPCSAWTGEAMLRMDEQSHATHERPGSGYVKKGFV